ncbi:hypothetical protein DDZ13_00445 [Coraliomargarita sinensis]|uniref:Uncharacterized protein n=1 Tax=Coraliomargarita sinensis TaxID=2174842 RepID=A0A317ZNF2_9BACT|nr:hypothetical protein [Coraliomargarita sinensis]PXA05369.1 hypothetical protein DDZ13_00445 [Coraliomargarita sinensis]
MPALLDNPPSVSWSHSDSTADFYELPTDGSEMHEALGWLLPHYNSVKLWMGLESEEGTELYLTASPSRKAEVVERLKVYEDDLSLFEPGVKAVGE